MFDENQVFQLGPDAASKGVRRIGWFDSDHPLKSGWAWGQENLDGGVADAGREIRAGGVGRG